MRQLLRRLVHLAAYGYALRGAWQWITQPADGRRHDEPDLDLLDPALRWEPTTRNGFDRDVRPSRDALATLRMMAQAEADGATGSVIGSADELVELTGWGWITKTGPGNTWSVTNMGRAADAHWTRVLALPGVARNGVAGPHPADDHVLTAARGKLRDYVTAQAEDDPRPDDDDDPDCVELDLAALVELVRSEATDTLPVLTRTTRRAAATDLLAIAHLLDPSRIPDPGEPDQGDGHDGLTATVDRLAAVYGWEQVYATVDNLSAPPHEVAELGIEAVTDARDLGTRLGPRTLHALLRALWPDDSQLRPTLGGTIAGTGAWVLDDLPLPEGVPHGLAEGAPRLALRDPEGGSWATFLDLAALPGLRSQLDAGAGYRSVLDALAELVRLNDVRHPRSTAPMRRAWKVAEAVLATAPSPFDVDAELHRLVLTSDDRDGLYGFLKNTREVLCLVQTGMDTGPLLDRTSAVIRRVDAWGTRLSLPGLWSEHDRSHEDQPAPGPDALLGVDYGTEPAVDPCLFGGMGATPVHHDDMSPDFWRTVLLGQALGDLLVKLGAITNCPHTGVELMATAAAWLDSAPEFAVLRWSGEVVDDAPTSEVRPHAARLAKCWCGPSWETSAGPLDLRQAGADAHPHRAHLRDAGMCWCNGLDGHAHPYPTVPLS